MATTERRPATALIQRLCSSHRMPDPDGPHVTMIEGAWSYCAGHARDGHEWHDIEARPRQQLESDMAAGTI